MTGLLRQLFMCDRTAREWELEDFLYDRLEHELKSMGILNMNACIACPVQESKYLNDDSIRFHSRLGFSEVGRFFMTVGISLTSGSIWCGWRR